jgi:hypothetical protein
MTLRVPERIQGAHVRASQRKENKMVFLEWLLSLVLLPVNLVIDLLSLVFGVF